MKKLFSFAIVLLSAATVFGQATIKPAVGLNLTDFSKNANGDVKAQVGYQFGGSVSFGKKIYFEPGFFFLRKSSEYVVSGSGTTPQTNFDLSGLRIPVTLGVHFLGDSKSTISVRGFGGASAFLLTSVKDLSIDDFNKASFGVFAGAGIDLSIFFVEASYEWSVSNIQKNVTAIDFGKARSLFLQGGLKVRL